MAQGAVPYYYSLMPYLEDKQHTGAEIRIDFPHKIGEQNTFSSLFSLCLKAFFLFNKVVFFLLNM